jgi:integrase
VQWPGEHEGGSLARRRYQRGNVERRGDRWIGRWREDIIGDDGVVRRERRYEVIGTIKEFPTKRLACRQLDQVLARINAVGYRPGRMATLGEFAKRWQEKYGCLRKPSTFKAQSSHLRVHIIPTLGMLRLNEIALEEQQRFVARLAKTVRRKTLLNVLQTLSVMLNTAKDWGYVCEGMSLKRLALPPREARKTPRFFTAEEARRIIAAAREPYATIYAVAAMTGMRAGELLGLRITDIDFERRLILVQRSLWHGKLQSVKSAMSVRALPLPGALARHLKNYIGTWRPNLEELLFTTRLGTPIDASKLTQRKLQPLLKKLGIGRAGLHAFRHTCASLLVEQGISMRIAQQQLGHSDPRITLAIYSHVIGDSHRQAVEKLSSVLDFCWPQLATNDDEQKAKGQLIQ